jgi:peptidoglycan/xylan/chitin deacetylase (PgdA/CDA1 family)
MILASVPSVVTKIFPSYIWRIAEEEKVIYFTFDDGPIPEATPWVLSVLKDFNAKATFFCVGDNVRKHPAIYEKILEDGHAVGNHTYNHIKGWSTENSQYISNIHQAGNFIHSNLFRPPHGLIRNSQFHAIRSEYRVVMWDVLSFDYDKNISNQQCLDNVISNGRPGSIVVFHDSFKAFNNMKFAFPLAMEYYANLGFTFSSIKLAPEIINKPSLTEWWQNTSFAWKRA